MNRLPPLHQLNPERFEIPAILKRVTGASRRLAELKGVAASIPHQGILINTLGIQEAKDSSAIENIVTTHDELFRDDAFPEELGSVAAKEVLRYRQALWAGFHAVQATGLLTNNQILQVQAELELNNAGFRRVPGTTLKDGAGRVVYMPPMPDQIQPLMSDLERFINDDVPFEVDPLIEMALIHHQFESIHPFYDGNGRSGRIINVLYLVKQGLLDIPVLYLSRHIVRTKPDYYRLLQSVRDDDTWEEWVLFMLTAVEETAREAIVTIQAIRTALFDYKHRIRAEYRFYSHDLINNLFTHPYTKPGRPAGAAAAAPIEGDDAVVAGEVGELRLPLPRMDDRPGRHEEQRFGARAEDLVVERYALTLGGPRPVRLPCSHPRAPALRTPGPAATGRWPRAAPRGPGRPRPGPRWRPGRSY